MVAYPWITGKAWVIGRTGKEIRGEQLCLFWPGPFPFDELANCFVQKKQALEIAKIKAPLYLKRKLTVMRTASLLLLFFLLQNSAFAVSTPVSETALQPYCDSGKGDLSVSTQAFSFQTKNNFWIKLKMKLSRFFQPVTSGNSRSSLSKKTTTWIAAGLLLSGVVAIALGAGSVGVWLIFGGLGVLILALLLAKQQHKTADKRDELSTGKRHRKWGWIIAAALATGGLVGLFIALGSWGSH